MSHFGILCPPLSGHINPLAALGRALICRGHRVTMFQLPDMRARVEREGLGFWPLGDGTAVAGELAASLEQLGRKTGFSAVRFTLQQAVRLAELVLDTAPEALRRAAVDLAIVDQNEPAGASAAESLGLPFISAAAALPLNREPATPPPFTPWEYADTAAARLRNRLVYAAGDRLLARLHRILNARRKQWRLAPLRCPDDSFSRLAELCTLPRTLDFPRHQLPACFHYLGPFVDDARAPVAFPWDRLDGRPLVYCSLGTLQNRREGQFQVIAEACLGLDVQLVVSAGGGEIPAGALPGNPLIVAYAPQLQLLALARLTITHAGLNTVLESLNGGVPLVAIPVTNDQPAVAARVHYAGAGEVVPLGKLSSQRLRAAIERVLASDDCKRRALQFKDEIAASGGVRRAADIVELAQRTGKPVCSSDMSCQSRRP